MCRFRGLLALLVVVVFTHVFPASAQQKNTGPVRVVASFSVLADLAENVGGNRVSVTSLVGANGDVHVYDPSPSDAKKVADAKLVVINGLGLEGWMPRLVQSSGGKATIVTATTGITPHEIGGHVDPHAWQSVPNAKIYVGNIRDALIAVDAEGADGYRANATAYLARLDALDREVRAAVATIPAKHRKVISTHEAFGYFGQTYGIEFIAPQGVSTDSEPSAQDIAVIITQLKLSKIPAVFLENISDPRLIRQIASETGAKIGGTLYSDSLTAENGEAPTYIDMVRHNIKALASALAS